MTLTLPNQNRMMSIVESIRSVVSAFTLIFFCSHANALIEIKAGYSQQSIHPTDLNTAFSNEPKIDSLEVLSGDIVASVPLLPIGVGLRYETYSKKSEAGAVATKINWVRTSILVNKRLWDTGFYFGPIATVSVTSDFKFTVENGTTTDYKADSQLTGTLGLEGGVRLGPLSLGAEAGYLYAPLGDLKTSAGTTYTFNGSTVKADLSGAYVRATLGAHF